MEICKDLIQCTSIHTNIFDHSSVETYGRDTESVAETPRHRSSLTQHVVSGSRAATTFGVRDEFTQLDCIVNHFRKGRVRCFTSNELQRGMSHRFVPHAKAFSINKISYGI